MQTRRDQLHAYRFMTRRAISALVTGEPDTVEPPMRRLVIMTVSGVMVAIVVAAAFLVIGALRPGSDGDWKESGTVVVERETGAPFLMVDGLLHPALNYPSAVLASDATSTVEAEQVRREDLTTVDHGATIGISGLPGSLPPDDQLRTDPVTICAEAEAEGADVRATVTVDVGSGDAVAGIPDDEAVVVRSFGREKDDLYLLWRGRRHLIEPQVNTALGFRGNPVRVGRAFLTSVPLGTPFATPEVAGVGDRVPLGNGRTLRVGQLVRVGDDDVRVLLADGLATVDDVQARLLSTLAPGGRPLKDVDLPLGDLAGLDPSSGAAADLAQQTSGLPTTLPEPSEAAETVHGVCASYRDGDPVPVLGVPDGEEQPTEPTGDTALSEQGLADVVTVPPGTGMLARAPRAAAVSLIADPGVRYQAATLATLAGFGYGNETPVELPLELLAAIPTGEALDPDEARRPVTPSAS